MAWLETTQGIITLISSAVVLVGALATTGTLLWKKIKEIAELIKERKWNEVVEQLKSTADAAMRAAEKTKASGADKKTQVLEAVQAAANSLGVEFTDALEAQISTFIDQSVAEYNEFKEASKKTTKK